MINCVITLFIINEREELMKKESKIELRIDEETKQKFIEYAKKVNKTISVILRDFIKECVDNDTL